MEVVRAVVDPVAVIITAHGGRARGEGVPHRGRLTYLRMVPFSRMWDDLPQVAVWRLRYRYTGWNGRQRCPVADLEWALGTAKWRYPGAKAILLGHSMGGRAALQAAGAGNVAAVCALAPWTEPADPVEQLRGRRVLIAHGDRDLITDPKASRDYAQRARGLGATVEYRTVTGAGHAMLRRRAQWRDLTACFVTDAVAAASRNRR